MGLYRQLVRQLVEADPLRLSLLSLSLLREEAQALLREPDLYLLEQLTKQVPALLPSLDPGLASLRMYAALDACRVDDFCYLFKVLGERGRVDPVRVQRAYRALALRGNVGGLEQLAKVTHVPVQLEPKVAQRAYEVLLSTGRVEAVDYVRQLSAVPVTSSPQVVQVGHRLLLSTGRYESVVALHALTGTSPGWDGPLVEAAAENVTQDQCYTALAGALALGGPPRPLRGFSGRLARLLESERWGEVPALVALCSDAEPLAAPVLETLVRSEAPAAVAFALGQPGPPPWPTPHATHAYALGVAVGDRRLVRIACERAGARLEEADLPPLLDDALREVDGEWVLFARAARGHPLPAPAPATQRLLHVVSGTRPELLRPLEAALGSALDPEQGAFFAALARGDLDRAWAALSSFGESPLRAALGPALKSISRPG